MSFNLYPYKQNKINNIFIFGIEKTKQQFYNSTYYLDKQKKEFEEKSKSNNKEKDKYNFKKFFINKFFTKETITKNTPIKNDVTPKNQAKESKVIIVFKSNILL